MRSQTAILLGLLLLGVLTLLYTTHPAASETRIMAYVTSYTYGSNTPSESDTISYPVVHARAGGTGSYADPITLAVGHSIVGGKDILDYPAGTIFYIPTLRKYFIVEDTCGDGPSPQVGPCHSGFTAPAKTWIDFWLGGTAENNSEAVQCSAKLTTQTGSATLILKDPKPDHPVAVEPIFNNGKCSELYGDTF